MKNEFGRNTWGRKGVGSIPDNYQTSGIKLLEICENFITV